MASTALTDNASPIQLVWPITPDHELLVRSALPLDAKTSERIESELLSGGLPECRVVTLDLSAAGYVDSDGIRWLTQLRERLLGQGTEIRLLVRPRSRVDRTLSLLQLQERFAIVPAEASTSD